MRRRLGRAQWEAERDPPDSGLKTRTVGTLARMSAHWHTGASPEPAKNLRSTDALADLATPRDRRLESGARDKVRPSDPMDTDLYLACLAQADALFAEK